VNKIQISKAVTQRSKTVTVDRMLVNNSNMVQLQVWWITEINRYRSSI